MRHHPIMFIHAQDRNGNEFGSEIRTDMLDQHWRIFRHAEKVKSILFSRKLSQKSNDSTKKWVFQRFNNNDAFSFACSIWWVQ